MSNAGKKRFELTNFDDLIGGNTEQIIKVPLKELHTFKDHPFHVDDDEKMEETTESIRKYGVLVPGIARPRAEGGYEIISGHRRRRGCELAGLEEMPVIVRNYSDDEATIIMVDANIQRENLMPSEKAFAYRMKFDAMKHQGVKGDKNTADQVGEKAGDSGRTVQRYIRLSYLIPELLNKVDSGELAMIPGERLSFLSKENQKMVRKVIEDSDVKLTKEKADEIKKAEEENLLTEETVNQILAGKGLQETKSSELLSFFGLPKTIRPEGSLLTTPGCGDGKYDCFSCARECAIRQESRLCQVATLGNPFPCSLIDNEEWKKNIKFSLYQKECQMLHPELAPIRAGDQEPEPCCLNCLNKTCYNRCETAKNRDAEEIKNRQKLERDRLREEEAKKPEPDKHPEVEEDSDHPHKTAGPESAGNQNELVEDTTETGKDCGEQPEEEELLCDDCSNASALTGNVDLYANCGPSGRNYEPRQNGQNPVETDETGGNTDEAENGAEKANKGIEDDAENYNAMDVSILLIDYQHDLEAFKDTECPSNMIQKQKILVDALTLLASSMEG